MKKNVLEVSIDKEINCSAEVAWWNYWDHEHLDVVHGGYKTTDMIYDANNFSFGIADIKIPFIPFLTSANTPMFGVQHDRNTYYNFTIQFGVLSKTTISIIPIERSKCKINMNYKFYLNGWRIILKPLLKKLIPMWNEKVWLEDYPVKMRRQKVIDICNKNKIQIIQKNFKLNEVLKADEAFVTGTFANIIPVKQINTKKFKINSSNLSLKIRELFIKKINKIAN